MYNKYKLPVFAKNTGQFPTWLTDSRIDSFKNLLLLMAIFPKTLFAFVGGHFVAFTFFTARHNFNFLKG